MRRGGIDFYSLKRQLLPRAEFLLQSWFPAGRMIGRELTVGSINGEPGQSFKFNVDKGIGQDFATGQLFGDLVAIYCAAFRVDAKQAAIDLGA